jgi:hypothetical protein
MNDIESAVRPSPIATARLTPIPHIETLTSGLYMLRSYRSQRSSDGDLPGRDNGAAGTH